MRTLVDLAVMLYITVIVVAPFFVFYAVAMSKPAVPLGSDWWFWLLPVFMVLPGVLVARTVWSPWGALLGYTLVATSITLLTRALILSGH